MISAAAAGGRNDKRSQHGKQDVPHDFIFLCKWTARHDQRRWLEPPRCWVYITGYHKAVPINATSTDRITDHA